jgi:polar amino acid transport system substrate-binding protein
MNIKKGCGKQVDRLVSAPFFSFGGETQLKSCKRLCLILLSLSFVLIMTSCHGENVLVVGVDISQIPLSYRDSQNNITGFEVDMATEAAKRAGMTVEFVPINWAANQKALSSGKVNSLWGKITVTKENQQNILFTKPYMTNSQIFVISSTSKITNADGLAGKVVGTTKGSEADEALAKNSLLAKLSGGAAQYYSDSNTEFMALEAGQIDAVAVDDTMGEYYINQNTFDYKVLPDKLASSQYAVGVRRNDSRLRNSIQTALDSMAKDGTSKALSTKWFGKDYTLK